MGEGLRPDMQVPGSEDKSPTDERPDPLKSFSDKYFEGQNPPLGWEGHEQSTPDSDLKTGETGAFEIKREGAKAELQQLLIKREEQLQGVIDAIRTTESHLDQNDEQNKRIIREGLAADTGLYEAARGYSREEVDTRSKELVDQLVQLGKRKEELQEIVANIHARIDQLNN